jgi:cell division protein FtsA
MNFGFIKDVTAKNSNIVVGLDVGSAKVCVVVGEVHTAKDNNPSLSHLAKGGIRGVNIIGAVSAPSKGIKRGVVINIEQAVESIREAVQKAEELTGVDIKMVNVGVTGKHIEYIASQGVIAVKESEIGVREVEQVIDAARAVAIPFDKEILHVIPSEFIVNGQSGITDPRGMAGVRLESRVQIITGAAASIQNLTKCCRKAGLEVIDVVFQPVATADAVLTQDEKDLGVALIDIGGGTTDMALFQEGNIFYSSVLEVGGINFTNDVAIGLRIPSRDAEQMKISHGCSMLSLINREEEIETGYSDGKAGKKILRTHLIEILQPRAEELFSLIKKEITKQGHHKMMNAGVVLTGGAVLMKGMDVMAENILELPVRIGKAAGVEGDPEIINNPAYAGGMGLLLREAAENLKQQELNSGSIFHGIKSKMSGWLRLSV